MAKFISLILSEDLTGFQELVERVLLERAGQALLEHRKVIAEQILSEAVTSTDQLTAQYNTDDINHAVRLSASLSKIEPHDDYNRRRVMNQILPALHRADLDYREGDAAAGEGKHVIVDRKNPKKVWATADDFTGAITQAQQAKAELFKSISNKTVH